jgi:hypothetical protein
MDLEEAVRLRKTGAFQLSARIENSRARWHLSFTRTRLLIEVMPKPAHHSQRQDQTCDRKSLPHWEQQ